MDARHFRTYFTRGYNFFPFQVDVIFFEELIENPMEVIVDLLNKLGIHIEEERKKCFIKHLVGKTIILLF